MSACSVRSTRAWTSVCLKYLAGFSGKPLITRVLIGAEWLESYDPIFRPTCLERRLDVFFKRRNYTTTSTGSSFYALRKLISQLSLPFTFLIFRLCRIISRGRNRIVISLQNGIDPETDALASCGQTLHRDARKRGSVTRRLQNRSPCQPGCFDTRSR